MDNEHYFTGDYFSASSSVAPAPGLDDVAAAFGMAPPPSWGADHQMMVAADSAAHFDSALSSLVPSPAGGGGGFVNGGAGGDDMTIGDLIGRLGSICNGASANNSCYSTPLSSPPRGPPPPPPLLTTTAFRGYGASATLETGAGGRLSRVSSSKSLQGTHPAAAAPLETSETEMSPSPTTPATTDPPPPPKVPTGTEGSARKRKGSAKPKASSSSSSLPMATAATTTTPKRSKVTGGGDDEAAEPPKDYIHVRARRGQATDSHSLAERVRRERISERMRLLQSLVPGCNKITGKALMLDEIINYVQSLQRQVEFLSMKLATMNPQLELERHYLPSKDMSNVSKASYLCGDPTTAAATATFSYAGEATGDMFDTYNCWDVDLQMVGATGGGINQDGPTTMASPSSSPPPRHALLPSHGFYGK